MHRWRLARNVISDFKAEQLVKLGRALYIRYTHHGHQRVDWGGALGLDRCFAHRPLSYRTLLAIAVGQCGLLSVAPAEAGTLLRSGEQWCRSGLPLVVA